MAETNIFGARISIVIDFWQRRFDMSAVASDNRANAIHIAISVLVNQYSALYGALAPLLDVPHGA